MTPKEWMEFEKVLDRVADKETLAAVKAAVEGVETNLSGSLTANVVKSIQRGIAEAKDNYSNQPITVAIAKVDVKKTIALAEANDCQCRVETMSEESVTFMRKGDGKIYYYIIEFY